MGNPSRHSHAQDREAERRWGPRGLTFAALAMVLSTMGACAEQESSGQFFIQHNLVLQADCVLQAGGGQIAIRSRGVMDVALTNTYFIFPSVLNLMPEATEATGLGAENLVGMSNNIQIIGGTVSYLVDDIVQVPQDQFVFTSGTIAPGQSSLFQVEAVPPAVGEFLRSSFNVAPQLADPNATFELVALIQLEGRLQQGEIVKSREYAYPITVCKGCLVQFTVNPQFCCDPAAWAEGDLNFPCFPGQDEPIDCRSCCAAAQSNEDRSICSGANLVP